MIHRSYDQERFPWSRLVSEALRAGPLNRLHEIGDYPLLSREMDQQTMWHRAFYAAEIFGLVKPFILEHVLPALFVGFGWHTENGPWLYQRVPTFRVQLPGNVAVGELHTDADYGHQPGEITCWIPLTQAWGTNSLWYHDAEQLEARSLVARPGDFILFDGVKTMHGNVINSTGVTRVSMDLRVVPRSFYDETSGVSSVSAGIPFTVGGYWEEIDGPA